MKERPIEERDFISLAEYCWEFYQKNDLSMVDANNLKAIAFNIPKKKVRIKKNISTPLLHPSAWHKIWEEYYENNS